VSGSRRWHGTRDALVAAVACIALVTGCGGGSGGSTSGGSTPSATGTPATERSSSPAPGSGATAIPIRFHSASDGKNFVSLSKQVGNRKVYDLRALSETGQYLGGDTGRSDFTNPVVTFYERSGGRVVARAPAGTIVEKDKTVRMSGGVTAKTDDGKTLASETLRYDDATQQLDGNGDVSLTTPAGEKLTGDAFQWNLRTGKLDMQGAR